MRIRTTLMTGLLASMLALGSGLAFAQEVSPPANPEPSPANVEKDLSEIDITNPDGDTVAVASFTADPHGVTIIITSSGDSGLTPGEHGVHIHETGVCDASGEKPYESAGGHFNPTDEKHGAPDSEASHAGDLGNLTVAADGSIDFKITDSKVTLEADQVNSLDDADGSAIIIHSGEDDLTSQPSGDSGSRVACGVIFPPQNPATPGAPVVSPETIESTPAS